MAPHKFAFFRPLIYLGFAFLAWWCVPTFIKSFLRVSFYEFQAPAWTAVSHMKDLQSFWALRNHSKRELIETGRDLARLNAAYELSSQENSTLRDQINHLEELLELPPLPGFKYEIARVVRRDQNAWWQNLIIRKGANYNIPIGAGVIFSGGVVGRIKEVHAYTAIVELISSPGFRIAGHFEGDFRPITYQGSGSNPFSRPSGSVKQAPLDVTANPDEPQRLISSHLGGSFPTGLTIGWVDDLSNAPDGLFAEGDVHLDSRLNALQEVAVLIPIAETIDNLEKENG